MEGKYPVSGETHTYALQQTTGVSECQRDPEKTSRRTAGAVGVGSGKVNFIP